MDDGRHRRATFVAGAALVIVLVARSLSVEAGRSTAQNRSSAGWADASGDVVRHAVRDGVVVGVVLLGLALAGCVSDDFPAWPSVDAGHGSLDAGAGPTLLVSASGVAPTLAASIRRR